MNNSVRINAEEHKYWNSDSADYWVSQKPALDRLLAPWASLLLEAAELSGGEQIADIGCGTGATTLKFAASVEVVLPPVATTSARYSSNLSAKLKVLGLKLVSGEINL